jgi:hypothetical protein
VSTVRLQVQLRGATRPAPPAQPTRIARLLALAHRLETEVRAGETDLAGIARRYGLTRARVTQITDLTLLAPTVQAELVSLKGRGVTERAVRTLSSQTAWWHQLARWSHIRVTASPHGLSSGCGTRRAARP